MKHDDLVAALKDPTFYPQPVEAVEYLQTHISSGFLTGDFAYKLKKPVDFGFLDFTTVAKRRQFCEAEVELNRRLAPEIYLRTAPITASGDRPSLDGEGEVVDWLVVMRQRDTTRLGPEVLARGELGEHHMDQLVEILVPFYRNAATGPGIDEYGTVEAVKFNTDENFAQTEDSVGSALSRRRFEGIRAFTDTFLKERRPLFERRIREGRIRESHGDLHLGNIVFAERPIIFDCIEFNERFRCGDVAVDLAFLAMDLDFRGQPELATRLIDGYVAASGDDELPELMDFYRCYRAYVRGKIACFTTSSPGLPESEAERHLDVARRYFELAERYTGDSQRPVLIILYGLMGTGKTSLASYLESERGWRLVGSDAVRKQLAGIGESTRMWVPYNAGIYSPEMNERTYAEMNRLAESLLRADLPVVMDGSFKNDRERLQVLEMARRVGAEVLFVETTCDPEEQRRRLESRQRTDTRSDGRIELMEDQRRDFDAPSDELVAVYHRVPTGTREEEARERLDELLASRRIDGGA